MGAFSKKHQLSLIYYLSSLIAMELEILKPRHSLAHLLAQAVQQTVDAHVALGTGPAVDD